MVQYLLLFPLTLMSLWHWYCCDTDVTVTVILLWYWCYCDTDVTDTDVAVTLMSLWHWCHWDSGVTRILASMGHWCHCDTVTLMALCHCGNTDVTATVISLRHWCRCDTDVTQRSALGSCLCRVLLKPVCVLVLQITRAATGSPVCHGRAGCTSVSTTFVSTHS